MVGEIGGSQLVAVHSIIFEGREALLIPGCAQRLDATLAANGLSFADVVKENVYTTDLDAFIKNKDIRKEFSNEQFQ